MENTGIRNVCQQPFPEVGKFKLNDWANILDLSPKTVKAIIDRSGIRTIHMGATVVVDAKWWWEDLGSKRDSGNEHEETDSGE